MSEALPAYGIPSTVDSYTSRSPGLASAFDEARKEQFLGLFRANGLQIKNTCKAMGLSFHTFQHHYRVDPAFKAAFDDVQETYVEELQAKSMQFAMEPKHFMDRCMQLRRLRPFEYAPEKFSGSSGNAQIVINVTGDLLMDARKKAEILDGKIVKEARLLRDESAKVLGHIDASPSDIMSSSKSVDPQG